MCTKEKQKLSLCFANYSLGREGSWRNGSIDPRIPDLGIGRRWVLSFKVRPFDPPYPIETRLKWALQPVWVAWRRKILFLPGLELRPQPSARIYKNYSKWHSQYTTNNTVIQKQTQWPESASELYRPSDHRLSAKLVPTFADRWCHVVSVTDLYCRNLGFLDRSSYFFFQVAPQFYSLGWVDPFQSRYFSENLVAPGIEPTPLDLIIRPQRLHNTGRLKSELPC
jgi:hypothetical protein